MSSVTSRTLADEVGDLRLELAEYNKSANRNRLYVWGLGIVLAAVTTLGIVVFVDDQNDDRRECELDNANSVRDSEVLIGAVQVEEVGPETRAAIDRYRREVQESLREC